MTAPVAPAPAAPAPPPELVTVVIDDVPVQVPKGTTIIEAAKRAGVLVPHYCYHPSLPSPAVCRMCLVEVEKSPKLLPACVTTVAEGQVVRVDSPAAKKARQGVLEFLLINHPLDCPICDQAGECELQDFVFQEGRAGTRYQDEAKRYNPVEEFGPDILYVANRCILCTRCVRFMDSVAQQPVLNVSERGDRAYIGIAEDQHLDHPWAGNVVDLCPVGSLVSRDFLHKARAWDLDKGASVCPGCSQGCAIQVETRDETVVRLRPRPNLEVNRHFMCDTGRLDYRWMNRGDRVEAPRLREGGAPVATDWDAALDRLHALLAGARGAAVLLAGRRASVEALGFARWLLEPFALTAALQVPLGEEAPLPGVPGLALRRERAPNLEGARRLGIGDDWAAALAATADAAVTVVLDADLDDDARERLAGLPGLLVVLATAEPDGLEGADVVLPVTSMVEESGVYVNRDGRAQRYHQARTPPGQARPAWWACAEVLRRRGVDAPASAAEAFAAVTARVPALGGLTYADLGPTGRRLPEAAA